MKKIIVNSPAKIKKAISVIKNKISVDISVTKNTAFIEGTELVEYNVGKIIEAIDFGFEAEDAVVLRNENYSLEFLNVKDHTHRKNLAEIRARVIGTEGKAKRTIELLTGSIIAIKGNMIGIIADADHLAPTVQGLTSLIQGAKHGNVFSYLEKQNANLGKIDEEDLGLKNPKKDLKNLEED